MKNHSFFPPPMKVLNCLLLLMAILLFGCNNDSEIIHLHGQVNGNIRFYKLLENTSTLPNIEFSISGKCDGKEYIAHSNLNGEFNFPDLPMGAYNFTLFYNNDSITSLSDCSFLGGEGPSFLNFDLYGQPDIKDIEYHFEFINNTIWIIGQLELDEDPIIDYNTIYMTIKIGYYNSLEIAVPFDPDTKTIKYNWISNYYNYYQGDIDIQSYFFKTNKRYRAEFINNVNLYNHFEWFTLKSDSTSVYTFHIP